MDLAVRPLHPLFAAEIAGVDVGRPLDAATVRALIEAIDRYAVVVFHGPGARRRAADGVRAAVKTCGAKLNQNNILPRRVQRPL